MESAKVYGNKYCAFELDGEAKYYMCPRNEYCCNFGCCVNLAFQFYQLWYYWLLIIIMFMICSGGGWWYRFCRQNDSNSTYPSVSQNVNNSYTNRSSSRNRNTSDVSRRSRVTSSHQRSRSNQSQFYIQPMWKGPSSQNIQLPPSYYSSTNQYNLQQQFYQDCPYHQLYGPPPSYDSVIQLTDIDGNGQTTCTLMTSSDNNTNINENNQIETNSDNQNQESILHEEVLSIEEPSTSSQHTTTNLNIQNKSKSIDKLILQTKDDSFCLTTDENKQIQETAFNTIPSTSKIKNSQNSKISSV